MIDIKSIYIRNFRSFGDYDTIIELGGKGPILIRGEVNKEQNKSNGAGKSSIIEAMIWGLFGRLSDIARPGDKVVNWSTGKDCIVVINTTDGYSIERTRKFDGHSDLFIKHDNYPVDGGDSTNANAQNTLNKLFGLDFDTFISSVFFGQFSGSFLSLSDPKKKVVIENLFGLGKLGYYSDVAKTRMKEAEQEAEVVVDKIGRVSKYLEDLKMQGEALEGKRKAFENNRLDEIKELEDKKSGITVGEPVDIEDLEKQWTVITEAESKISEFDKACSLISDKIRNLESELVVLRSDKSIKLTELDKLENSKEVINKNIEKWEHKSGTICPTCDQSVNPDHVANKIEEIKRENANKVEEIDGSIKATKSECAEIDRKCEKINKSIEQYRNKKDELDKKRDLLSSKTSKSKSDKMTINEAKSHNESIKHINDRISEINSSIDKIKNSENPYVDQVNDIDIKIKDSGAELGLLESQRDDLFKVIAHLKFIYKAYSDKKNIRSFITSGYIPILNNRLSYYFNELELDNRISFNELLQVKSDKWGYEVHSGGEKKRVDLALMCAIQDTFTSMYGKMCNILVLDEIDKELDRNGVEDYVRLIMDDLSARTGTILVISHKDDISHAFPAQLKVLKEDGFSYIQN